MYLISIVVTDPIKPPFFKFYHSNVCFLGDGLCPAMFLLMSASAMFLFIISLRRIGNLTSTSTITDLLQVQWAEVIGWHLFEGLFFYGTGHQTTFPTIQWSAAFIGGFSGAEYGSSETNAILGYILPALFIGWNTYISRIWFGLFLPMLLVAPFALWMTFQSIRPKPTLPKSGMDVNPSQNLKGPSDELIRELGKGELLFIERIDQTRSQVFDLCIRYCILQSLRVFATMMAATVHMKHLMVWKIFAPRFIFEGIGCVVSFVSVMIGYMIFVRIQNSVSQFYRSL